jgi:hypothetical protein
MEEAKLRALSIDTITSSSVELSVPLLREYGFLQLRMLCELIALGCLVAHGDIERTTMAALQKEYKAGVIIKRLEKLHPNFYPSPRKPIFSPGHVHLGDYDREFLTKRRASDPPRQMRRRVASGSLRDLLDPKNQQPTDFRDIQELLADKNGRRCQLHRRLQRLRGRTGLAPTSREAYGFGVLLSYSILTRL